MLFGAIQTLTLLHSLCEIIGNLISLWLRFFIDRMVIIKEQNMQGCCDDQVTIHGKSLEEISISGNMAH